MPNPIDRTGMVINGIEFLRRDVREGRWLVRCHCGKEWVAKATHITAGDTRSCGCASLRLHQEARPPRHVRAMPEFEIWIGMRARCLNPNNAAYSRYGGRGIKICDRWRDSIENFRADMGPRPSAEHTIERIDNSGHYEPGNCRWATRAEQNRNTRKNVYLTHDGRTMCVNEWARAVGLKVYTLHQRLSRGWSVERALTEPLHPR